MKVALLLSGGMGKGAYQVGALKTLSKYIDPKDISVVSTASVGTLNGYLFCAERLNELEATWLNASSGDSNGFISKLINSELLKNEIEDSTAIRLTNQQFYTVLLSMSFKRRDLEYFNLTEIEDAKRRSLILQASVKVPLLAKPVKIDGKNYFDGATVETNPVKPVLDKEFDYAIAIYFDRNIDVYDCEELSGRVIKLCFDDGTLIKNATMINQNSVLDMISKGERSAEVVLSEIFKDGVENVEKVLENIKLYNRLISGKKKRKLSSSHMLSFINKVTKLFVSKKKA